MNRESIIVTGGAGYIGSHTAKALSRVGYEPVVVDNLSRGNYEAVKWGPLERVDVLDTEKVRSVIQKYRPIAVIHFAAFTYVGESVEQPINYYENNISGLISLVRAMQAERISKLVFSSSAAVYGIPSSSPISENAPLQPVNPYGVSKMVCEQILNSLSTVEQMESVSLRYFNAAGADAELETGEAHEPETHLIPLAIRAAYDPDFVLTIFGDDYDTPDGTAIRDYVHVEDIASAHLAALDHLVDGGSTLQLNVGTSNGYSVAEVIRATERVTGKQVKTKSGSRRPGDPPMLVANGALAKERIGWLPDCAQLDNIISTAAGWYRQST